MQAKDVRTAILRKKNRHSLSPAASPATLLHTHTATEKEGGEHQQPKEYQNDNVTEYMHSALSAQEDRVMVTGKIELLHGDAI